MPLIFEHLSDARRSLKGTGTRTLLTILGVAIGIASITAILSLSSGIIGVISRQIESLEGNIILVRPGPPTDESSLSFTTPLNQLQFGTSTLTRQDVDTITRIEGVEAVAPLITITGNLHAEDTTVNGQIVATSPDQAVISGLVIRDGQFIDTVTNPNTAVIGPRLAIRLFGTDQAIGRTFTVRGQLLTVIGVLEYMDGPINFNSIDFDQVAIVNLEAIKNFHGGHSQIQQINIKADSPSALPEVVNLVEKSLTKNHNKEKDFTIISGKEVASPSNQLFVAVVGVMVAIAAISLVVGGVGIMNILLVGVAERTREIGLRKAIGASNRNILEQFLVESLLVSLAGGILGYIGGYVVAFGASQFLTFKPNFDWQIAAIALGVSMFVGILFGLYPAIRAARKDPIESLRQYH